METSASLSAADILGAVKVRFGIGRMNYTVKPGLYSLGYPGRESPILVSANYKLSFDSLRKNLGGLTCWILVLDTKGVNVWCAAGKGTFGTEELVRRIQASGLEKIVTGRTLIVPQLGASGINAWEVAKQTGFAVKYGPVRACDIKEFIAAGMKATEKMRQARFTFFDRLVLTPVELVSACKAALPVFGLYFLLNLFAARPFALADLIALCGAILAGAFAAPVLLPFIPGRAFAWKGFVPGALWTAFAAWRFAWFSGGFSLIGAGYALLLPAVSSYLAMNFTGASAYTSFSGVIKEMKIALPFIVPAAAAGSVLVLLSKFIPQAR